LPLDDQHEVIEAWQRFERLGEREKQQVLSTATQVDNQSDAEQLLATMHRFALWRQSLLASQLEALQPLEADEPGLTVDLTLPPKEIVDQVVSWLDSSGPRRWE
jgi:hypothetical protein